MNVQKMFAQMLKANANGKDITIVTDVSKTIELLRFVLSLQGTTLISVDIAQSDHSGYCGSYLLSFCANGYIYCEPAITETGRIKCGTGLYLIDKSAIEDFQPEEFILDNATSKIKIIGE